MEFYLVLKYILRFSQHTAIFSSDLDSVPVTVPVPGLNLHQRSDFPQHSPLLGFDDGIVFPPGASIIPGSARL